MNLTKRVLVLASAAVFAAGCGSADFKKNKEGLVYKIISNGKGEVIKPGTLLKLNFSSVVGDSVMFTTFDHIPAYGKYDTMPQTAYDFVDFLGEMKVGDSATYVRSVDTLVSRKLLQYGGAFKKGGTIRGYLKVLAKFKDESEMSADHEKEVKLEQDREIAGIEKMLKDKKISNAIKTENGVFVVIEKEGTGPKADTGTRVTVNYTGYLKSGTKFDSNTDSSFQHVQPFSFNVGQRMVIPGWDEGIKYFNTGSIGKMYIPAMLAYGPQAQGDKLPGFSDLIFDIEVTNIGPATVEERRQMPQGY